MINNHNLYIIVAADQKLGIGKDGKMPWHLKNDLKYFQDVTTKTQDPEKQNMVLMGRTTWESIPEKYRPLPDRKNVVLTRDSKYEAEGADIYHSMEEALHAADDNIENIFIIGGGKVFSEIMTFPQLDGIYLTQIHETFDCDTFFPVIPERFGEGENLGNDSDQEEGVEYNYLLYSRQD